jgi:hypothetical protein
VISEQSTGFPAACDHARFLVHASLASHKYVSFEVMPRLILGSPPLVPDQLQPAEPKAVLAELEEHFARMTARIVPAQGRR